MERRAEISESVSDGGDEGGGMWEGEVGVIVVG